MELRSVLFIMGVLLACIGGALALPLGISILYADGVTMGILSAMAIVVIGGLALAYSNHSENPLTLTLREGFAVVGVCWVAASFAGGLPFILTIHTPLVDAVFEAASGFTTTGATIFGDVEALPKSLLMWRSLTHWLGGLGIIVLSLVILPLLGVGGMQLYKAEVTGPTPDKLTPRMHDTAVMLWSVYCLMTVIQTLLLVWAGMDWFDSLNHTFATVATGGFSTKNASIAAYPSPIIQWIIILFMFLAGINFSLHFHALRGNIKVYRDRECLTYSGSLLGGSIILVIALTYAGVFSCTSLEQFEAVTRAAVFQLISLCTTTGFVSENYSTWPSICLFIFIMFMFMGGCAGSTSGGVKSMRILLLFRMAYQEIFRLLHPHSVRHLKMGGKVVSPEMLSGITGFLFLYLIVLTISTILLCTQNMDLLTAFTASLTCLSNVGPGLGTVGPVDNFGHLTSAAKWCLTLVMLLGRLEIYALILLFIPEFWRR